MNNAENIGKLIPILDNEIEEQADDDIKNLSINKIDTSLIFESPMKPQFGDLSQNSFVVIDSMCQEESDNGSTEENNSKIRNTDVSNVYMKSILDLFRSLNFKMDNMSYQRSCEKVILEEVQSHLCLKNYHKAIEAINKYSGQKPPNQTELYKNFIEVRLREDILEIRSQMVVLDEVAFKMKNAYSGIETKLVKKMEENERLRKMINQQSVDHKAQIDGLVSESNLMLDGIVETIKELNCEDVPDSQLQVDILQELRHIGKKTKEEIAVLREQNAKKDEMIAEFRKKAKSFEITHLNSQIDELKSTQKKLQDENINLSQILSKMSEKNTKLKQELLLFNTEYKKSIDAINKKNETINRQKMLIEMFQEKLSGTESLPIEELKRKRNDIEARLERETDYFTKQALRREKLDCEKRLSDFLNIVNKPSPRNN